MADILPYLGVKQTFGPDEIAGKQILLPDLAGSTVKEAEKILKDLTLSGEILGEGDTVTAQLPEPGQTVPGGSQVLLFLDGTPKITDVTVPDFTGQTYPQAVETAEKLGLYILPRGNRELSANVTAAAQSEPPNTQVPMGTTIILTFIELTARD